MENLTLVVRIYSQDIGIEYDIKLCAMFIMRSGKRHETEEIEQPNQKN